MNNFYCRQYLEHGVTDDLKGLWNTAAQAFKDWKKDYNAEYYQKNKEKWKTIYNDAAKKVRNAANQVKSDIRMLGRAETYEGLRSAIKSGTEDGLRWIDMHANDLAKTYLDTLDRYGRAAISVGSAFLSEFKQRHDKNWQSGMTTITNDYKKNWNAGADSIKSSISKAGSNFQNTWGSGVDSIRSGIKSFAKNWKAGW